MNFIQAIASAFRNCVNFSSRSARSEYWYFYLFLALLNVALYPIDKAIPDPDIAPETTGMVATYIIVGVTLILAALALTITWLAVSVRRLHDLDKSGWWVLLYLIPLIGMIILIVWFCQRGTIGPNRFGPDPLEGKVSRAQAF